MALPECVVSRDGNHTGKTTGATRPCQLEGCTGIRLVVRWEEGKITYPCTKGLEWKDGVWRIM